MKGRFKLFTVSGIDVFVHWTFSLLLLFIVFINYRSGHDAVHIIWTLAFVLVIFLIVTLHEFGHALAARRYNIKTKDITLLPIGGVARLESMPEKPFEEFVVAIAGPLVNVALAIVLYPFVTFPGSEEAVVEAVSGINADNFVFNLFLINIILAVFNLIPAFPMDGGRVLRALLSSRMERHKATYIAARVGQIIALFFIVMGFFVNPFLILIGFFVMMGAQAEAQQTKNNFLLKGSTLKDVLMRQYETLRDDDEIQVAVDMLLNGQTKNFLVLSGQRPVGTLNRDEIIKALSEKGKQELVRHAMNAKLQVFSPEDSVEQAYKKMMEEQVSLALVYAEENLLGVVDTENIVEFILVKSALEEK